MMIIINSLYIIAINALAYSLAKSCVYLSSVCDVRIVAKRYVVRRSVVDGTIG